MSVPTKNDVNKNRIWAWSFVSAAIFCFIAGPATLNSASWLREEWTARHWLGVFLLLGVPGFGFCAYVSFQILFEKRFLREQEGLSDSDL